MLTAVAAPRPADKRGWNNGQFSASSLATGNSIFIFHLLFDFYSLFGCPCSRPEAARHVKVSLVRGALDCSYLETFALLWKILRCNLYGRALFCRYPHTIILLSFCISNHQWLRWSLMVRPHASASRTLVDNCLTDHRTLP